MFMETVESMRDLVGMDSDDLSILEMSLRALIIYITAIVLVRLGEKRFMGKNAPFDMILGVVIGSVLSRAITGNAPLLPTVGAAATLVAFHWLFSVFSYHSDLFGRLIKGRERALVENGRILWDNMRKSHISRKDLEMAIRKTGQAKNIDDVAEAHFERSGGISVLPRRQEKKWQVVEVNVVEGVQKVRIEMAEAD